MLHVYACALRTPMSYLSECIVAEAKKNGKLHGVGCHPGEVLLAVRWYERDESDNERRTFHLGDGPVEVFNSADLRLSKFNLEKLRMPQPAVQKRGSARLVGGAAPKAAEAQRWRLPHTLETKILTANW